MTGPQQMALPALSPSHIVFLVGNLLRRDFPSDSTGDELPSSHLLTVPSTLTPPGLAVTWVPGIQGSCPAPWEGPVGTWG